MVRLDPGQATGVLAEVERILDGISVLAPEPGGSRLLAMLRLNEYLLDVSVWRPQSLVVAGHRFPDVSGIVIPVTGTWRHRVLIVQGGEIEASPALLDTPDLAALERVVESVGGRP